MAAGIASTSLRLAATHLLADDVSRLKYVSGAREEALRRLGIERVGDLLLHVPRRYLDFTHALTIEAAPLGEVATIVAVVDRVTLKRPRPRLTVVEVSLVDETGVLEAAFFKQPWLAQQLAPGYEQWRLERELSLLEMDEDALWRPFRQLSGGEKTKLQLAALFLQEDAFPLIDEPTNHLDTESRQLVAAYALGACGAQLGTCLLVSEECPIHPN